MWDVLATGNDFACIIVFFSTTVRISVFALTGRTRPHFAERVCHEGISPTIYRSCGKDLVSPTLTWQRFQMLSRKGVKYPFLGLTHTGDPQLRKKN